MILAIDSLLKPPRGRAGRRAAACALVIATVAWAGVAGGRLVKDKTDVGNEPRTVFGQLATAWENGDERTLAEMVHADGLRVTDGRTGDRVSQYSPSQAYYYFRNVFQSHRTLVFSFDMMQDSTAGERVHGMATWKRRRPDSEHVQTVKLVCTLVLQDDVWKLAEINTIR